MLTLSLKSTRECDWRKSLQSFVSKNYSKEEAEKMKKSFDDFHFSRQNIARCSETTESAKEIHQRYFFHFSFLTKRFPVGKKPLDFETRWYDPFQTNRYTDSSNPYLELASVLYNLGVIACCQAVSQPRSNSEALKTASQLFQQSAAYFEEVKQISVNHLGTLVTTDLSPPLLDCLVSLMLAQAQECFYEKAAMDKMKDSILAKLAYGAKASYQASVSIMESKLKEYIKKGFVLQAQHRSAYYTALAHYRILCSMRNEAPTSAIGEQIARLRLINEQLQECLKITRQSPGISADISYAQSNLAQEVTSLLQSLEKENNTIYYENVPPVDKIPSIEAKVMVKATPSQFLTSPHPTTADLFSSLVPLVIQQSMSRYETEKGTVVKKLVDVAGMIDQEYERKMTEHRLPTFIDAYSTKQEIPKYLRDKIDEVQGPNAQNIVQDLEKARLQSSREASVMVNKCKQALQEETSADDEARRQFGSRWTRPTSASLNESMWRSLYTFEDSLAQASKADESLAAFVTRELPKLECLQKSFQEIAAGAPQQMTSKSHEAEAKVQQISQLMKSLSKTKEDRAVILAEAEQFSKMDDIRNRADLAALQSTDAVVSEGLTVYEPFRQRLLATGAEHTRVFGEIKAIQDSLEEKSDTSASGPVAFVVDLVEKALISFETMKKRIGNGIQFYTATQESIQGLHRSISDWTLARDNERRKLTMSLQGFGGAGHPPQAPGGWPAGNQYPNPSSYPYPPYQ